MSDDALTDAIAALIAERRAAFQAAWEQAGRPPVFGRMTSGGYSVYANGQIRYVSEVEIAAKRLRAWRVLVLWCVMQYAARQQAWETGLAES